MGPPLEREGLSGGGCSGGAGKLNSLKRFSAFLLPAMSCHAFLWLMMSRTRVVRSLGVIGSSLEEARCSCTRTYAASVSISRTKYNVAVGSIGSLSSLSITIRVILLITLFAPFLMAPTGRSNSWARRRMCCCSAVAPLADMKGAEISLYLTPPTPPPIRPSLRLRTVGCRY